MTDQQKKVAEALLRQRVNGKMVPNNNKRPPTPYSGGVRG
jgi:hypothetical protein